MPAQEIIAKKRDGKENSEAELSELLLGYLKGDVKEYQMAAWLMAVYLRGLTKKETSEVTRLMWKSGVTFPRETREDFWIDKHSSGGVGDKPSLILVPLVTAVSERLFGPHKVKIPMVSGRGLGHSGGTLDKLESVPGFNCHLPLKEAMSLLEQNDFFMMGQTEDLAPLDRLIYALRDVTATVDSVPLIVSSIMSKKLSENLDGLVFDVKTGSGAFMKTEKESETLAQSLIAIAKEHKLSAVALVTRMDEPLGRSVGHQLELEECEEFLTGKSRETGLSQVTLGLAAQMIHLASRKKLSLENCREECEKELKRKKAFDLFVRMFQAQGGNWNAFEKEKDRLRQECQVFEFKSTEKGYLSACEAKSLGLLLGHLGGGRNQKEDAIDRKVGFECLKKVGDAVLPGNAIIRVYFRAPGSLNEIQRVLKEAIQISPKPITAKPWIVETIA